MANTYMLVLENLTNVSKWVDGGRSDVNIVISHNYSISSHNILKYSRK